MNRTSLLAALPALLVSACAGMVPTRAAPGVIAQGVFTPQRPAATSFGADPLRTCPTGGTLRLLLSALQKPDAAPNVATDGRLCAAAEAWLGWPQPNPPESVTSFVAGYFGLPNPQIRMVLDTVESDDDGEIFIRLIDPVVAFAKKATAPRIGLATVLVKGAAQSRAGELAKGYTKVVLLMQDAELELEPLPRQIPVGAAAPLSGRFPGTLENPKLIVCDSEGKLLAPPATPGKEFKTELKCGPKPGRMQVEIRGERGGVPAIAASFPVGCGEPPLAAVPVPEAAAGGVDLAASEQRLLEQVNAERKALGLGALLPHEELGKLARSISEQERQQLARGAHYAISPVEELRKAGISTPLALFNPPALARSADDALAQSAANPVLRCNSLSAQTTHAGIGFASSASADGSPLLLVTQLFIKVLPPVDPVALRAQLRAAVLARRNAVPAAKSTSDAPLEQVAQQYAEATAAAAGSLENSKSNALLSPLYKAYKNIDIIGGAKSDPLSFADEPSLLGKGAVLGLGVAVGDHPSLGKNAVYIVVLLATKR